MDIFDSLNLLPISSNLMGLEYQQQPFLEQDQQASYLGMPIHAEEPPHSNYVNQDIDYPSFHLNELPVSTSVPVSNFISTEFPDMNFLTGFDNFAAPVDIDNIDLSLKLDIDTFGDTLQPPQHLEKTPSLIDDNMSPAQLSDNSGALFTENEDSLQYTPPGSINSDPEVSTCKDQATFVTTDKTKNTLTQQNKKLRNARRKNLFVTILPSVAAEKNMQAYLAFGIILINLQRISPVCLLW